MALVGAQFVNAVSPNPVGSLQAYAGASAPTGWLLCDGSQQAITTYPELYSVLGTTYGSLTNGSGGAGSTHFRVPDLRGRMPIGAGNDGTAANSATRTRGATGGDTRLQSHSHTGATGYMNSNNVHQPAVNSPGGHSWGANFGGLSGAATFIFSPSGINTGCYGGTTLRTDAFDVNHTHNFTTNDHNQSSGSAANMPPFLVTNYIIKAVPDAPRSGLAYGSTPPIVTALPANPQFGDVVTYIADATNGVAWNLQYDASGTYPWKFIGGSSLFNTVEADQAIAPSVGRTWGDLATVGPTVTLPLAGQYDVMWGARMWNTANAGSPLMAISFGGAAPVYSSEAMWPYNNGTGAAVAPGGAWQGSRLIRRVVSSASQTAQAKYSSEAANTTSNFQSRWLQAVPVCVRA